MVEIGVEGEHLAVGVVGREADLDGLVAGGGLGGELLDAAAEGALVAQREVGSQVEVVADTAAACPRAGTEHLQTYHLVAHADDDVVRTGLDKLDGGEREVEDARLLVLELGGEVVGRGDVDADEGGELLVDADGADVEHAAGDGVAGGDVLDEAEAVHVGHVGAVGTERADGIDALVGVVDVDALEVFLEELELGEPAVGDAPVGQHAEHGGEEGEGRAFG